MTALAMMMPSTRSVAVLEQLYKLTPMEESFCINNVALVDGQPVTLGLKELLNVSPDHRLRGRSGAAASSAAASGVTACTFALVLTSRCARRRGSPAR